jgi:hypothetical protein
MVRISTTLRNYYFLLVGFSSPNDFILSSDSLDEKLDTSIEGLRNKE